MTPTSSSAPSIIRPLVEITTSGLTHSWGSERTCGRQNGSPLCSMTYYNQLFRPIFNFFMWIAPWKDLLEHEDNGDDNDDKMKCRKNGQRQYNLDLNFAEFDFDWDKEVVTVNMLGRNIHDEPLLRHRFRFDELSGNGGGGLTTVKSLVPSSDFDLTEEELVSNSIINSTGSFENDEWICVSYKGRASPIHHDFAMAATVTFAFLFAIWPILLILALTCASCMLYKRRRRKTRSENDAVMLMSSSSS